MKKRTPTTTTRTRSARIARGTKETQIVLELALDGRGRAEVQTGLGFFDHMLSQIARHGHFDLKVQASGDLETDSHHVVEDVGLALGDALRTAVGDDQPIARYGEAHVPLDETLSRVIVDLSGRPYCVFEAELPPIVLGDGYQVEMTREFFIAFAMRARANVHASVLYGINTHHKVESLYKALARALRFATRIDGTDLPSTKGTLSQ
jgi:imidazoleglycerol-phosphate dehydratase